MAVVLAACMSVVVVVTPVVLAASASLVFAVSFRNQKDSRPRCCSLPRRCIVMLCVGALVVVVELPVNLLSAGRRNWPASRRAPVVVIVVLLAFSVDVLPWCAVGGGVGGVGDGVDGVVVVVVALLLDALPWCAVGGGVGGVGVHIMSGCDWLLAMSPSYWIRCVHVITAPAIELGTGLAGSSEEGSGKASCFRSVSSSALSQSQS
mmetsp:Transcript_82752/g.151473  ORF Transcript_82752/g.151473 Transcript_82752/m.151473 type:complete len:206 (+) Transcript_82752:357-974(+)